MWTCHIYRGTRSHHFGQEANIIEDKVRFELSVRSETIDRFEGRLSMDPRGCLGGQLTYSRSLIDSGMTGLRSGCESYLKGRSLPSAFGDPACRSLVFAALGTIVGLIPMFSGGKRERLQRSLGYGALGCGIGFCAAFVWQTRQLTSSMARGAMKKIEATSDEHWLEHHPIDYA